MRFSEIYKQGKSEGRAVLSLEFFPPKDEAALSSTLALVDELAKLGPDFMTVTYGAGGGARNFSREIVRHIAEHLRRIAVQHITCIGRSRADIANVLSDLEKLGIRHILALRGDLPKGVKTWPGPSEISGSVELTEFAAKQHGFSVAVAGYPETHKDAPSPQSDLDHLKRKLDAGAEVVFTQLFFDPKVYFNFIDRCRNAGIAVPIVPGIMPIGSISQIKRFTDMCGASIPAALADSLAKLEAKPDEVVKFGTDYAIKLCEQLIENGAPGIHLYTLNKSTQARAIIQALAR